MATLEKNVIGNDLDNEVLEMGVESTPSYDRIGQTVVHLPDFDGTVYAEDVGQLASQHHQSHLLGFEDVDDFLEKLIREVEEIVLTRGSEGAEVVTNEEVFEHKPPEVDVEDTTGAGGALAGAYSAFRQQGIESALEKSVHAAALSTQKKGAMSALPKLAELKNSMSD